MTKLTINEPFDMAAEREKLRQYYSELKNKKKEQRAKSRSRNNSNGSFSRHLDWYEDGKIKVKTLREQEREANAEVPLVVPDVDPTPNHICNRLYEESRDELICAGKEKRKEVEKAREIAHPSPLPSRVAPTPKKRLVGSSPSPDEVVERLYNQNTISLDLSRTKGAVL